MDNFDNLDYLEDNQHVYFAKSLYRWLYDRQELVYTYNILTWPIYSINSFVLDKYVVFLKFFLQILIISSKACKIGCIKRLMRPKW